MTSIPHHTLLSSPHHGAGTEAPNTAEQEQPAKDAPWAPCEQFVRKRLGLLSPMLSPLAQTIDYCADYVSDSGRFWTIERKSMRPRSHLGTYEEILEPWFMGRTLDERMKGIRAFCAGTVYASWGAQAPPLSDETLMRSLVDAEFKKKYFGGNRGFIDSDVEVIRMGFKQRILRPCALLHFRKFVDFMIGKHADLAAAQTAVNRLLARAHPDRYERLLRGETQVARDTAKEIYDALLLVREMLKDSDYGPALYEPRRLERSQWIGWKMGIAAGAAATGFFLPWSIYCAIKFALTLGIGL